MQRSRISLRRFGLPFALLLACLAAVAGAALGPGPARAVGAGSRAHGTNHYVVGLFGDMPYGPVAKAQYPALLGDLNAHDLAFSVFDGDLKAGGDGACTDSLYTFQLSAFNSLRAPLIFTPGDNDWTDCWGRYGPGTGGFDPEERLNHERQLYFRRRAAWDSGRSSWRASRMSRSIRRLLRERSLAQMSGGVRDAERAGLE